ncbi:unnamed protein product [Spirodela intermedia]|uniref:FLZ-type domain-containing protein n=1 Tax=Spirodela intermedia TaxID=51605 RepID=A0A7I8KT52_SPIIN|nr:unnamed protein product [Spirodela intermedia]
MLLGKRARPAMQRTTSLLEINSGEAPQRPRFEAPATEGLKAEMAGDRRRRQQQPENAPPVSHLLPPWIQRWSSMDAPVVPAPFLRICGLCKRRLGPGKDTFMYRGDVAFCSMECRQRRMNLDERKERCSVASRKDDVEAGTSVEVEATAAA